MPATVPPRTVADGDAAVEKLASGDRRVFEKIFDELKFLCKVATADIKEARQLEKMKKTFEDAYRKAQKAPPKRVG